MLKVRWKIESTKKNRVTSCRAAFTHQLTTQLYQHVLPTYTSVNFWSIYSNTESPVNPPISALSVITQSRLCYNAVKIKKKLTLAWPLDLLVKPSVYLGQGIYFYGLFKQIQPFRSISAMSNIYQNLEFIKIDVICNRDTAKALQLR